MEETEGEGWGGAGLRTSALSFPPSFPITQSDALATPLLILVAVDPQAEGIVIFSPGVTSDQATLWVFASNISEKSTKWHPNGSLDVKCSFYDPIV